MFDTHCHLNFKAFLGKEKQVIAAAKKAGVNLIVVPGTDIKTSKKAIELAEKFPSIYAAVGIHPHHLFKISQKAKKIKIDEYLSPIKNLINHPKVVALGEVGLDHYLYQKTKYKDYHIDEDFIKLQKEFFLKQIELAVIYKKTLIIHNRQAKDELLFILKNVKKRLINISVVFHCCQPDEELLDFALKNHVYIGVDGDITYDRKKQTFVKKIPLELLVLETDSPFLLPEPLRREKLYPNEPKNLPLVAQFIAQLLQVPVEKLVKQTRKNGRKLFKI